MSRTTARSFSNPAKQFVELPKAQIPRSVFTRSHSYKTAMPVSKLVPFFVDEVLPGDTFNLKTTILARLSTPIVPFMDNLYLRTFFFFVPNRLVWDHWESMNGDQRSGPTASTDYLVPQATINNLAIGTLGDFLCLATRVNQNVPVSELPLRAISLIWNEWFRDENLQAAYNIDKNTEREYSGDQAISSTNVDNPLLYSSECPPIAKFHDYFTSALPWPQKGPGVEISLGGSVPAVIDIESSLMPNGRPTFGSDGRSGYLRTMQGSDGSDVVHWSGQHGNTSYVLDWVDPALTINVSGTGSVDLSKSTPISINDLRQAFQIQKLYERDARGGTRYTEILRAHFGVVSPDARLQRPEYLGGNCVPININQVIQQSGTTDTSPQGNTAAYSMTTMRSDMCTYSAVEHGYLMILATIRVDHSYQQGLRRMWSRKSRFDFYHPMLANLGEMAVLNKEIYCQGNTKDDEVFGYQEPWADYRYHPNIVTGEMRSNYAQTLDAWHYGDYYESLPMLSDTWIKEGKENIDRTLAVQSENSHQFICDFYFDQTWTRPMPIYGVPGIQTI